MLKQVKLQKANYRTALWKLGSLPKFSKTVMADLNVVWDRNIFQVCLTALSKNHFFGASVITVPETHNRFQPNSVRQYYSKFCKIFYISIYITSDTDLLSQPHNQTINAFMLYFF